MPLEGRHRPGNVFGVLAIEGQVLQWALRMAVKREVLLLISLPESRGDGDVGQLHVGLRDQWGRSRPCVLGAVDDPAARAFAREQGGSLGTCPGALAEVRIEAVCLK